MFLKSLFFKAVTKKSLSVLLALEDVNACMVAGKKTMNGNNKPPRKPKNPSEIISKLSFALLSLSLWKYLNIAYKNAHKTKQMQKKKFVNPKTQMAPIKNQGFLSFKTISIPNSTSGNKTAISVKWLNHKYQVIQPENAYAIPVIFAALFEAPKYLR